MTTTTIRALCGRCLLTIRQHSHQPRKAMALTHDSLCTDCGQRADYFIGIFVDGKWIDEKW